MSCADILSLTVVHERRCGPNEFAITGSLKSWDIGDMIHHITQPTLVLNGRYDMAQDSVVAPFVEKLPKMKWVKFTESAHVPFWEEPEYYYNVVGQFLAVS